MRKAKLWSVLFAAVLLCACIFGILSTGASASDTRIPTATVTYVVGTDGDTVRACIEKAATQTWGKNDVLRIQFSGTDSSAYASPDAANGISGYTLFEVTTVFREDNTKLPIVIEGTDADRGATLTFKQNDYNATNDYFFTNLTIGGGESVKVAIYAGCGELVFENTTHENSKYTYYYGDNMVMDAFEGWDQAKLAANLNGDGLLETGITFGNGVTGLFQTGTSGVHLAAVGYDGNAEINPVLYALKGRSVTTVLTEDEVQGVKDAAPLATYKPGNVMTECIVKPWDTEAYLVLDCGNVADKKDTSPDYPTSGARYGVSPVRKATITQLSGGNQYLSAGDVASTNETYVGDTAVIIRGGRSGEKMESGGYSDVGIRLCSATQYVGNLTLEVHEDDPAMPTFTPWIQCSSSGTNSCVFGNFHFLMTGGEVGHGHSVYNAAGTTKVYNDSNDGYWGAPVATGTVVNEVRGGQIWAFYGSRFAMSRENTPVSIVLPGTGETLTEKVAVHNIISGGIIGGEKISGDGAKDTQGGIKGFFGQYKGTKDKAVASVCNEIIGGTIYAFHAGNSGLSSAPGDIYNFIYGTEEKHPTFLSHFHGSTSTVTADKVVNVIKGYPVFQNAEGVKMSIFGGCKNGTVESVTTYLGGMPVFDDFYGGVCGAVPATGKTDADYEGVAGKIHNVIALDHTETAIPNYIWGGNGYHTVAGVNGAAENAGNSENYVSKSITMDIYSGHFNTLRGESACGKHDNVPITVNVYGGQWNSSFMAANRTNNKGSTALKDSVITTNIYDGIFKTCYMGGQNPRNQEFVNNIYGGTFNGWFYGGGSGWAKKVTNNVYGGDFVSGFAGGGSACGAEAVTNNIYGGIFRGTTSMGAYSNPATASNIYAEQTLENNFYGGEFYKWVYCGHRDGTTGTIENNFLSGEKSPVRDSENALNQYLDQEGKSTLAGGSYFHDQVVCGIGYTEASVATNYAKSITNTFEGGLWTKEAGGYTDITIHGGMRWGVVENVTNNVISGHYYRYFGGCDYGFVTGTVTNNFGKALAEGEEAPVLTFKGYATGGGQDAAAVPGKIETALAKAEADRTDVQKAWAAMAATYGEDYNIGAEFIVNNVYYGTFRQFFGGSYGSNTEGISSKINTITNKIKGGTFNKLNDESTVYAGGCFRSAVIETGIINNVDGATFNGNWYGGSVGTGKVSCPAITNTINAFEGNKTANAYVYFGNGAPDFNGVVKTVVNDFDAGKSYVMGGSTNVHNQPEGAEYGIDTTINGGTFCGFWGLGGGGSCVYNGNIRTVVNGGTFNGYAANMPNSLAGGPRNGALTGNIELVINDGIFDADVVGGTIYGSYDACAKEIDGNINVTIKGGEFRGNIYGVYKNDEITCSGTVTVNVEQTAGVALKLGGKAVIDSFTANGEAVEIGAKTDLEVKALTGALVVKQTEGWAAHDYLKLPAASQYTVVNEAKYGSYTEDDTILVKGVAVIPVGATLRLAERVGVRIVLNKEDVEAYGEAFTYEVTLGETVLAEGGIEQIRANNYSILFDGIGLNQFGEKFTVDCPLLETMEYSIADLAVMAQTAWAENAKWKAYADALIEFHNVYNLNAENTLTPEAVELAPKGEKGEADGVVSANVTLLMADAAGIRLNVELSAAPENAKILINGNEIVSDLIKVEGNVLTADLYFAHEYLAETFVLTLESEAGVHLTYTASIEALANQLAADDANENKDNATAFLVYIQKAVACK